MPKAYVSATYEDLVVHRDVAGTILRRFGYEDLSKAYYTTDEYRPVESCLRDLAECDLYIGLFAWRYGFIPKQRNPQNLSITEMEYRRAVELKKPRLLFVDKGAKASMADPDFSRMMAFRRELLKEKFYRNFTTPESLKEQLTSALQSLDGKGRSRPLVPSTDELRRIEELAASPERIARFLSKAALRDRGRLALLESPTTAGVSDFLRDQKVDQPVAFAELIGVLDASTDFEPDPLWLAWITNIHAERLSEIGQELRLHYSGKTPE